LGWIVDEATGAVISEEVPLLLVLRVVSIRSLVLIGKRIMAGIRERSSWAVMAGGPMGFIQWTHSPLRLARICQKPRFFRPEPEPFGVMGASFAKKFGFAGKRWMPMEASYHVDINSVMDLGWPFA
jgi:hypothetical protein